MSVLQRRRAPAAKYSAVMVPPVALAMAALLIAASPAPAQRRGNGGGGLYQRLLGSPNDFYRPPNFHGNPPYDGHFVFARIMYRGFEHWAGREGPGWSHDYPDAEINFMKIMRDVTDVNPFVENGPVTGGAIVSLEDPAIFKYPVSYMSEPGGWHPNVKEITALHDYLLKGGFIIFDDFREGWRGDYDWTDLQRIMGQVLPGARWVELTGQEPIFDSFFKIDPKTAITWPSTSAYGTRPPSYWGIFQDNDPHKRLLTIANVDDDVSESWQWSGTGFVPVTQSNDAFKLGVNYIIYALTH